MTEFETIFVPKPDETLSPKYEATCLCGAVRYHARADPVDAKICHCTTCQKTHGAPMQWAAIFHKHDVRITVGINQISFYNTALDAPERILPCKLACALCRSPIADEGRRMWLAFPSQFDFESPSAVPEAFMPTCHIFYGSRVFDMDDGLPKWSGHRDASVLL